ncbi:MAG TPA: hypothetical protein VGQ76_12085 [Thermoanaerobaculia bacterium]|nr:hypothetical protein [Thermoanaerobaculia bacterium]
MTVQDLLRRLVEALGAAEIPYMLTGSYASSLHSIPRATRNIDIVLFPNRDQLTSFIQSLPADRYHSDLMDAIAALRQRSQFNVIDYTTGWKVDFIIPAFDEFHVEEFARRRTVTVAGPALSVVSPEDIVLAKLLWAKAGESERQIEDAATVVRLQGSMLDLPYVEKWVRKLQVDEQWASARTRAKTTE